ncbi:PREDICTED: tuberoinfundibular peptide of 39 residues [Myotis brandtii]|uniref:tuberoinfundibular peptide of 39 residues n=1 Tax=Myotis brandtii TaxID=109478 RepID=UPI0003BBD329|nr:PREDICTED: tuberoinfundibular peptide of 39 residues [Myotis brandtii]
METRQVPRSSRARLLLLLLLLVPWGVRTASGVALPPAGVFRLAALERRRWLNSYMHKLLVLDAR